MENENNITTADSRIHEQYIECFNSLRNVAHDVAEHDLEEKMDGRDVNPFTQRLLPHIHACMRFLLNYMDVRWKENGNASDGTRNYRHFGAPCCGNCKWFQRLYEDTFCEHPKNFFRAKCDVVVEQPMPDMVCDWWEKKEEE